MFCCIKRPHLHYVDSFYLIIDLHFGFSANLANCVTMDGSNNQCTLCEDGYSVVSGACGMYTLFTIEAIHRRQKIQ